MVEPMQIGAKELYDAIQEMGARFDERWNSIDQKLSDNMQQVRPELARLDERVSRLEKDRQDDRTGRQWLASLKVTIIGLAVSTVIALVIGVLGLTVGRG